jgi:hypothetical protein
MTHPITPPPELVQQWADKLAWSKDHAVFTKAAQWGADQELEACCEWLQHDYPNIGANALRAARRPKLPTLKEQALIALHAVATGANDTREQHQDLDTIRKALEALPQ